MSMSSEDLNIELLRYYGCLGDDPKTILENKIKSLMDKGLSREEAIRQRIRKAKIPLQIRETGEILEKSAPEFAMYLSIIGFSYAFFSLFVFAFPCMVIRIILG